MRVSFDWLKELVEFDCNIKEFAERITMSGTKVETVINSCEQLDKIFTGKILEIKKHPDADKLVITKINIGEKILQVITGAKNIFENAIIPVAINGARLHDGTKIKKNKLRGVLSEGMMCSIDELGGRLLYPDAPDGIYIFDQEVKLGLDACELLKLNNCIIEFEITSNRSDCLSVIGIARETAGMLNKKLKYPEIEKDLIIKQKDLECENENFYIKVESNFCKRYMAQLIKNIKINESPFWLRKKLIACGIRPINNIVDVTNYVMLETGQPLHAFDADKIYKNKIIIRVAHDEKIISLDGIERKLENTLVISDPEKILAIAGIMGCASSKITHETKNILLESACFDGNNIRTSSNNLKLRTDASSRYEKHLDPNLAEFALRRAVYLIKNLSYGEIKDDALDCYLNKKKSREIKFDHEKINNLLGTDISRNKMSCILNNIELETKQDLVKIPSFRDDIENTHDLAEEIARFYGYDKIDFTLPNVKNISKKTHEEIINNKIKNIMTACGAYEIKTFSFESPKVFNKLLLDENKNNIIRLINPLGEEFSIMRPNSLNGMLTALANNFNHKNQDIILFELGKIYLKEKSKYIEKPVLTIGAYGEVDFYLIKNILENLFESLKINNYDLCEAHDLKFLHPYRNAKIFLNSQENNNQIGWLGELHPDVAKNYDLKTKIYLSCLELENIYPVACKINKFKPLPKFPGVYRDLSLLVNQDIKSKSLIELIYACGGNILEHVKLADIYQGVQIPDGMKSISYKLLFRSQSKTLSDQDINPVMQKILDSLTKKYDANLRT